MIDLKIYSFNVRGISDKLKRRTIFRHLKRKYPASIFLLQETHSSTDNEQMWKLDWNGKIYFSHGTNNSCGVATLISPDLDLEMQILQKDDHGRFLAIVIQTKENTEFAVYNIYAPVRSKVQEQLKFLSFITDIYNKTDVLHTIMGGDFNTVFNPEMDKQGGDMKGCINSYTEELLAFMEANDLIDAVRYLNPNKKIFTRVQHTPPVLSRIDHWIIPSHLSNYLQMATAYPGIKSDHSIIFIHLTNSLVKRGRGFWKFNSTLLHDLEYIQSVSTLIDKLKNETISFEDKQLKWEYIKTEIRGFTIQYSSRKNKAQRDFKMKLEKDLYDIESELHSQISELNVNRYKFIKEELEKMEETETKGAIVRSKVRWAEAGEKNTKYFLNLEKKNAVDKHICQLQVENGKIISDPTDILKEQKHFFEQLYSDPCPQNSLVIGDVFKETLPQLSQEQTEMCEGLVTEAECAVALKNMKNGKSPGCDGFTVEFYKVFWNQIKHIFVESINYAFKKGELSVDQKRGIITLIPKKDKIRILLKNWRPITLLNTDYKILTKCLAFRLNKVLPSIIDLDQTGFLKGRYIGENIRTISDLIDYTSLRQQPGIILLLDFEKAFDTIKWSFILDSLKLFNFGPDFIQWVKIIYTNTESTVINHGSTAGFFKLHRGIRQGCPLSPYLFIIAVELLANGIRKDNNIKGIKIGNTSIKVSQLADDTTVFVSDFDSVEKVIDVLALFHSVAGLKLNLDKTIAKCIGSLMHVQCNEMFNLKWTTGPISTLGITISNDPHFIMKNIFEPKLQMFSNILNMWSSRGLSLKGRVTILKSLAIPKLLYPMSVLPIPTAVVEIVDKMIVDFIWNKRKPKIKKDVIIQNIENGGIKAPHFATMVEANRLSWIKRLTNNTNAKWKAILCDLIKPMSIEHFTENFLNDEAINAIGIPFYTQLYFLWNKMRKEPQHSKDYLEQVLWNNKLIQLPTNPKLKSFSSLQWPELYKAGICKVKDLFTQGMQFIDLLEFCSTKNIKHNFLQVARVKKAIPKSWVMKIIADESCLLSSVNHFNYMITTGPNSVDVRFAATKAIYDTLISSKYVTPTAVSRWTEMFEINKNDWPSIYKQPYIATRETKIQSLQYKIINRIVPCRKWLHDQRVIESPYCKRCNDKIDDIIHHFIECNDVKNFWQGLEKWWNRTSDYEVKFTNKHIIFGLYYNNYEFECVNCVILIAKWYIQKQVYLERRIDFYDFLVTLKQHLQVERYICTNNNKLNVFTKKWSHVWDKL